MVWNGDTASVVRYMYIYISCVRLGNRTTKEIGERGECLGGVGEVSSRGLECCRVWRGSMRKSVDGERARITRDDYLSFR